MDLMRLDSSRVTTPSVSAISLVLVIVLWYFFATFANSVNKVILGYFPYAGTLTLVQTLSGIGFSLVSMYFQRARLPKSLSLGQTLLLVTPLAMAKDFGQVTTAIAIERMAVSFVHTIKATSPVMMVFVSKALLGEEYSLEVILSLIPIITGVGLSTMSEVNFDPFGFLCAIISVIAFSLQNLYSKYLMSKYDIHYTVLVFYTSIVALFLLFPFWFAFDAGLLLYARLCCWLHVPNFLIPGGGCEEESVFLHIQEGREPLGDRGFSWMLMLFFFSGVCHFGQVITAIAVLARSSAVTYAVANTFKRVFVIIASVIYFRNPVSVTNALGTFTAILGIAWYNRAKRRMRASKESVLPLSPSKEQALFSSNRSGSVF
mmetsp:Transcript_13352/g.37974  ORF Transcript_13352/g.37974 Transcript_13352/m.37974 type:complete len:374 (+) Transcript_13352:169-1290(+)|eukprot:CAMPEP_0119155266 /NCGR_PEP_ID=MMETSP1310-20130426/51660_1 /TAXON_ID=464262 /ORGANISM="Genus nov. species nov., Strain RCC2339" /LENGTH=373 /DNA_ID=CAMNT_0007147857 /DNA_START=144 /DNA_END=1265 /DNA_ORIENTATION=+